jgi:hypothetical protein
MMTIEVGVWIALAVSLVVLAKTIWDLSQRQSTKSERVEPRHTQAFTPPTPPLTHSNATSQDYLWISDYHLMLLPRMIRKASPFLPVAFFVRAHTSTRTRHTQALTSHPPLTHSNATSQDYLWISDYHLMLLPRMIRKASPSLHIAFFVYTHTSTRTRHTQAFTPSPTQQRHLPRLPVDI